MERREFGGGSVMVWGGITSTGRKPLVIINGNLNAVRYRDEIIRPQVIPFVQGQQRHITLQQDNSKPHVARVVRDVIAQHNIDVLPWSAVSTRSCTNRARLG